MKTSRFLVTTATVLAAAAIPAMAQQTFTGSGDADGSAPNDGGAISSVVVNNNANNISFTINATKSLATYIFYSIEIQDVGQGGSGYQGFANPWGPSVGVSTGENAIINTYNGGATPILYSGGSWAQGSGTSFSAGGAGSTFATITLPLSSLGLSAGSSFYFDVISSYTSPSGQAAYSALDNSGYIPESDGAYQPWNGTSHYDSATSTGSDFGTAATEYTVSVATPEPSTFALMGVGALALVRRAFKRTV